MSNKNGSSKCARQAKCIYHENRLIKMFVVFFKPFMLLRTLHVSVNRGSKGKIFGIGFKL